jgi:hypothetical protein
MRKRRDRKLIGAGRFNGRRSRMMKKRWRRKWGER